MKLSRISLAIAAAISIALCSTSTISAGPLYLVNLQNPSSVTDNVAGWNNINHALPNPVEVINDQNSAGTISLNFGSGTGFANTVTQVPTLSGPLGQVYAGNLLWGTVDGTIRFQNLPVLPAGQTWGLTIYSDINASTTVDAENRRGDFDVTADNGTFSARLQMQDGVTVGVAPYSFAATTTLNAGNGQIANAVTFANLQANAGGEISLGISDVQTAAGVRLALNGFRLEAVGPAADDTISINFMRQADMPFTALAPDAVAGVKPAANWNNVAVDTNPNDHAFGPVPLFDSQGNLTNVTVASSIVAGFDSNNGNGNATANHTMMNGSLYFDNADVDTGNITIGGLDGLFSNTYDVYVYFDSNASDRNMTITIDGQSVTGFDNGTFDGTFTLAAGAGVGADYAVFRGLSFSSFSLDASSDIGRAAIAGIQLVATPEPASCLLWCLALAVSCGLVTRLRHGITGQE